MNLEKSKVSFSRNMNEQVAVELSNTLGIAQTADLGTYLGAPCCIRECLRILSLLFLIK